MGFLPLWICVVFGAGIGVGIWVSEALAIFVFHYPFVLGATVAWFIVGLVVVAFFMWASDG